MARRKPDYRKLHSVPSPPPGVSDRDRSDGNAPYTLLKTERRPAFQSHDLDEPTRSHSAFHLDYSSSRL
ncbi:hypothetical protein BDZ89DRAFT_1141607 [Hymenopellis radicata]|nr:hypothetical protein BDZ89DRAFT_1141607 [Hymenopellis radicata]